MNRRSQWYQPSWLAIGAVLLLATGARAPGEGSGTAAAAAETAGTRESLPESSSPTPGPAVAGAGVRAFIDPTTGELTANPSPEQLQRMALAPRAALSRSMVGLRPFDLDRGGRGVNLQGRFQSALRVELAEDGTFRTTCGDPAHDGTPHSHVGDDTTVEPAVNRPASDQAAER